MIPTNKLHTLLKECQIELLICDLPSKILGCYHGEPQHDFILINESIIHNPSLYRTVLAEEVGHYFTTIGDCTPKKHMCYSDRIIMDYYEEKALKWAARFLTPAELIIQLLNNHKNRSLEILAEALQVTENFLLQTFKFMSLEHLTWSLNTHEFLDLSHLPSIFVFSKT